MTDGLADTDTYWLDKGTEQIARARAGTLEDIELAVDVTGWPDT